MKIVIAPDSFKESLTALEVANAIETGFKQIFPNAEYVKLPMADGGEGTVQSLVDATQGRLIETEVTAPLGNQVKSFSAYRVMAKRRLSKWQPHLDYILFQWINAILVKPPVLVRVS